MPVRLAILDVEGDPFQSLTPSEREVLLLLARGMTNQEIAEARHVSLATVRTQLMAVYQKLRIRTRTEAVALYLRRAGD